MLYPQDLSLENNPSLSSDNVNLTLQIWDFYMGLPTGGRIDDYPGIVVNGLSDEFDNGLLYNVLFYSGDFPPANYTQGELVQNFSFPDNSIRSPLNPTLNFIDAVWSYNTDFPSSNSDWQASWNSTCDATEETISFSFDQTNVSQTWMNVDGSFDTVVQSHSFNRLIKWFGEPYYAFRFIDCVENTGSNFMSPFWITSFADIGADSDSLYFYEFLNGSLASSSSTPTSTTTPLTPCSTRDGVTPNWCVMADHPLNANWRGDFPLLSVWYPDENPYHNQADYYFTLGYSNDNSLFAFKVADGLNSSDKACFMHFHGYSNSTQESAFRAVTIANNPADLTADLIPLMRFRVKNWYMPVCTSSQTNGDLCGQGDIHDVLNITVSSSSGSDSLITCTCGTSGWTIVEESSTTTTSPSFLNSGFLIESRTLGTTATAVSFFVLVLFFIPVYYCFLRRHEHHEDLWDKSKNAQDNFKECGRDCVGGFQDSYVRWFCHCKNTALGGGKGTTQVAPQSNQSVEPVQQKTQPMLTAQPEPPMASPGVPALNAFADPQAAESP